MSRQKMKSMAGNRKFWYVVLIVAVLLVAFQFIFGSWLSNLLARVAYDQNGGPTAAQVASIKRSSFDDAQKIIDSCNVEFIRYIRYDIHGPFEPKNTYIEVFSVNNGANAYGPAPPDVYLPFSDRSRLESAVNMKNDNLTGPYPRCQKKIIVYPYSGS